MRARHDVVREALSLVVWWAVWSLADTYLLAYTPAFELGALGMVAVWVVAWTLWERRVQRVKGETVLELADAPTDVAT